MAINMRKAKASDIQDVFNLSNLDATRKYSINPNPIPWERHLEWFEDVLKSERIVLYIVTDENNTFLGQVRYNLERDHAVISIGIADAIKGKGLSLGILLNSHVLIKQEKNINTILAVVNNENVPSKRLFERAGYKLVKEEGNFSEYVLKV